MREILFEYGFESVNGIIKKVYYIGEIPNIAKKCDVWNVLPVVYVRQFTGLTDKNGVRIFDGDKLGTVFIKDYRSVYTVVYRNDGCWCLSSKDGFVFHPQYDFWSELQVIGNIH